MYNKGDYVVCGNRGVCKVDSIAPLNISGVDKEREYYILKPVYLSGSTVYVPVDTADDALRELITRDEAEALIARLKDIPLITITNEKLVEQDYKECMKTNSCEEWFRVIKTIYNRKQQRLAAGRKVTAVDAKYIKLAEENLYGELAIVLDLNKSDVEDFLCSRMEG